MSELNLAGAEMNFVTYHSLDVIIPVVVLLVSIAWTFILAFKALSAFVFVSSSVSDSKKRQ